MRPAGWTSLDCIGQSQTPKNMPVGNEKCCILRVVVLESSEGRSLLRDLPSNDSKGACGNSGNFIHFPESNREFGKEQRTGEHGRLSDISLGTHTRHSFVIGQGYQL